MKSLRKKIILSAGGTGGHLFPAQALAMELKDHVDILFVGGGLKTSPYFDQNQFAFEEITTSPLSVAPPHKILKKTKLILKGIAESRKIIGRFKPDLCVGFGSFFTFPLLTAALFSSVPFILHEQNAFPGIVNRLFSRFSKLNAISFPDTALWLKGKTVEVDFPLRWPYLNKRAEAAKYFNLSEDRKTILVFGGSAGAIMLNNLFLQTVNTLPKEIQILHFIGNKMEKEGVERKYRELGIKSSVKEFEPRMDLALSLADCVISRSGASTIMELIEWEIPAILVPYPFATHQHQVKNGAHFVERVKGGEMFLESELNEKLLRNALDKLLKGDIEKRKDNIHGYKINKNRLPFSKVIMDVFV